MLKDSGLEFSSAAVPVRLASQAIAVRKAVVVAKWIHLAFEQLN